MRKKRAEQERDVDVDVVVHTSRQIHVYGSHIAAFRFPPFLVVVVVVVVVVFVVVVVVVVVAFLRSLYQGKHMKNRYAEKSNKVR